jgi:hypothetical protein
MHALAKLKPACGDETQFLVCERTFTCLSLPILINYSSAINGSPWRALPLSSSAALKFQMTCKTTAQAMFLPAQSTHIILLDAHSQRSMSTLSSKREL